jgi:hypothetical protein
MGQSLPVIFGFHRVAHDLVGHDRRACRLITEYKRLGFYCSFLFER